jgi:hypothetical protein
LEIGFATYSNPDRDGLRVDELPVHNPYEPWRDGIRESRYTHTPQEITS